MRPMAVVVVGSTTVHSYSGQSEFLARHFYVTVLSKSDPAQALFPARAVYDLTK